MIQTRRELEHFRTADHDQTLLHDGFTLRLIQVKIKKEMHNAKSLKPLKVEIIYTGKKSICSVKVSFLISKDDMLL